MQQIKVIDSHTGGEPTRIIVSGGPELGSGTLAEQRDVFRDQHDEIRSAVVNEPRGSDVLVGGLLREPLHPHSTCGIIFFNNAAYLGMCGHGTIGLMVTLRHLGRIEPGRHQLETPVGLVQAELIGENEVQFENVPAYRYRKDVAVDVPGYGQVVGDIAWGGNWFFLIKETDEKLELANTPHLTQVLVRARKAVEAAGITGEQGALIDHFEFFGPPDHAENQSKNFVLCPGLAYDRSPCGTGMSAKLACLAADNELEPGETWRQESIVGSVFSCSYRPAEEPGKVIPKIAGTAHISGESTLLLDPTDPFCMGIRH